MALTNVKHEESDYKFYAPPTPADQAVIATNVVVEEELTGLKLQLKVAAQATKSMMGSILSALKGMMFHLGLITDNQIDESEVS